MIEKLHSTYYPGAHRPPGPDAPLPMGADTEQADYRTIAPVHCWVLGPNAGDTWVPGLLVEWRHSRGQLWQGRARFGQLVDGRWVLVEAWVVSNRLKPVGADT